MTLSGIPGGLYLVDTSAQARRRHPAVREILAGLLVDHVAATCVTVDLEARYSGRNATEVSTLAERRRSSYVLLPINETIAQRARDVQGAMAARGLHRGAGVVDLLTAAIAEYYDADFEQIAASTGQAHRWVVPRGSVP